MIGLQVRLQERNDHFGHLLERSCPWQGFPAPTMAAKGGVISILAELGEARHDDGFLIVQAFDQQVTPVALRDDLRVAKQAAQLTLEFGSVMFGG